MNPNARAATVHFIRELFENVVAWNTNTHTCTQFRYMYFRPYIATRINNMTVVLQYEE